MPAKTKGKERDEKRCHHCKEELQYSHGESFAEIKEPKQQYKSAPSQALCSNFYLKLNSSAFPILTTGQRVPLWRWRIVTLQPRTALWSF